ncbi:hypothetical protein Tco_1400211 [Tanacetum coccineum]
MALVQDGKVKNVTSRHPIGQSSKGNVTSIRRKHKDDGFLLLKHSHNKNKVTSKDCQLGNPSSARETTLVTCTYVLNPWSIASAVETQCMRTRSQARSQNRRQQQLTTVIVEEPEILMADNRTMAQMLQAPIEGYEDAIVVPTINANNFELKQTLINLVQRLLRQCPHHGFSELHQLDTFYNSLNTNDQDALDSAAGGNFLDKMPRDGLAIIKSKSKVRYLRSRAIEPRASTNAPLSTSTPSNSFEIQQMAALLEDKMNIRMSRLEKAISEKQSTPATIKAVEEVCVTCGLNHNFNNCPLTRNDFSVFHDNIHQFQQTAAVGNFVQRNPPNLANQMCNTLKSVYAAEC